MDNCWDLQHEGIEMMGLNGCLHIMFMLYLWPVAFWKLYIVLSTCCAFTHLILIIISQPVVFITFVYACVFKNVNKLDSGMRVHQNTWGRMSQALKRD